MFAKSGELRRSWRDRMVRRERLEACGEVADLGRRRADAEPTAVVLQHIDARAAVGRVDHHVDGAGRLKHVAQRPQAGVGVGQMVQHAGADDVLEASPEFAPRAPRRVGAPPGCRGRACASGLA